MPTAIWGWQGGGERKREAMLKSRDRWGKINFSCTWVIRLHETQCKLKSFARSAPQRTGLGYNSLQLSGNCTPWKSQPKFSKPGASVIFGWTRHPFSHRLRLPCPCFFLLFDFTDQCRLLDMHGMTLLRLRAIPVRICLTRP